MENKKFMRSLRLTQEPRFISPFEQRLINYGRRDEAEMRSSVVMAAALIAVLFIISLFV